MLSSDNSLRILEVTKGDLGPLVTLAIEMHEESAYRDLPFNYYKLSELLKLVVDNPKTYCGFKCVRGEEMIGFFGGFIAPYFFADEKIAYDLALFVTKEHRGSTAAVRLIQAYERWARDAGASQIQLGVTTGVQEERTVKLFERLGYNHCGRVLKKDS